MAHAASFRLTTLRLPAAFGSAQAVEPHRGGGARPEARTRRQAGSETAASAWATRPTTAATSASTTASTKTASTASSTSASSGATTRPGTWLRFDGRNLGLDSRQLRFEHNRQGNWGYFIEYGQIPATRAV